MLEEHGTSRKFADGSTIFKQGDDADQMYVIRSGKVRVFRSMKGKETTLDVLGPGEFFGEMALFADRPRSASAQAVEDAELHIIDKYAFMGLIKEPVVYSILEKMSERIREVDDKIEELSVQDQVRKEHLGSLTVRNQWFV